MMQFVSNLIFHFIDTLKDECRGNALRAHIRIGGHFMG